MILRVSTARCSVLLSCALIVTLEGDGPTRPASTEAVRPLVRAFNLTGRRAIAAAVPRESGVFVAAVYTGSDLFVVRARHPAAGELTQQIQSGQFQRVFFALRATPTPSGKFFVYDAGADGVLTKGREDENVDEVREDDVRVVRFNGDLSAQRLTQREYAEKLAATDARYARLLRLLTFVGGTGQPGIGGL